MVVAPDGVGRKQRWVAAVCAGVLGGGLAVAQTSTPPQLSRQVPAAQVQQPVGTITGHVYCSDTQRPARFATVQVLSQDGPTAGTVDASNSFASRLPRALYRPVGTARTALDGSFVVNGVPAGDYYVVGMLNGYISPVAVARMTQTPISGAAFTHVEAEHSADVTVSLVRGAVVTGRVVYDDGAPVSGVAVRVRVVSSTSATAGGQMGGFTPLGGGNFGGDGGTAITDDRGVYRVVGVAPGSYNVAAMVETETSGRAQLGARGGGGFRGPGQILNVFAPNAMRRTDARVVEIRGGETVDGIDLQVALAGLKTLTGSVEAKADGHLLNGGNVTLADASDSSLTRNAPVDTDGTFRIEYLPPGNYTLTVRGEDRTVSAAASPGGDGGGRGRGPRTDVKRYQAATQAVVMGDHDVRVDTVQLDEVKAAATPGAATASQ